MKTFFVCALVSLLLVASLTEAKKAKVVKRKAPEVVKVVKPAAAPAAHVDAAHHEEPVAAEGELVEEAQPIVRPRQLKLLSAYDKCKAECRRQRDAEGLKSYVQQLRDELSAVEASIAAEEEAAAAAGGAPAPVAAQPAATA